MMRANLWLRSASRVLVRVATFRAKEFYELENRAKKIDWARYLGADYAPEFRVSTRKSKLYHSDAIAQRLLAASSRPKAGSREPAEGTQLFVVRVVNNEFTISADTSGDLLHMRGYREESGKAPLRENLAAALLLAAEWTGETALVDPFCGSGTIPIEGALIARRIPPGRRRQFAFMRWPDSDKKGWHQLLSAADMGVRDLAVPISGSDRDAGVIEAARGNAARAGADGVQFEARPISAAQAPAGVGLVATNPPYGKRVSEGRDLRNLYAQFGHALRSGFGGWDVALYSPDRKLDRQLSLPLAPAFQTVNGGIPITAMIGKVVD